VPRPNADCRERLLRLYAGRSLDLADASHVVEATDGVTASFIKELVRRAVLRQVDHGGALDERQALTRSILGG